MSLVDLLQTVDISFLIFLLHDFMNIVDDLLDSFVLQLSAILFSKYITVQIHNLVLTFPHFFFESVHLLGLAFKDFLEIKEFFFQVLNLLLFGFQAGLHLLGTVSQNRFCLLEILDLELVFVKLGFLLLQLLLDFPLLTLEFSDLLSFFSQNFFEVRFLLAVFLLLPNELIAILFGPFDLALDSLDIVLESADNIFQLFTLFIVDLLELRNLTFMLILLLRELLLIHSLESIGSLLAVFVLVLDALKVHLKLIE